MNLNGLRAALKKGLESLIETHQPEVLCFQEIRIRQNDLDLSSLFPSYPYRHFNFADKPGYSGTAILSQIPFTEPMTAHESLLLADEGRYQFATFDNGILLGNLYLPSGTSGEHRQNLKLETLKSLNRFLTTQPRSMILTGDFNLTRSDLDLKNWKGNKEKPGCTTEERQLFEDLLSHQDLIDTQRHLAGDQEGLYTWWSYRAQAFEKDAGWRIDYALISKDLVSNLKSLCVQARPRLSDHAALLLEIST